MDQTTPLEQLRARPATGPDMLVATYNVHGCRGPAGPFRPDRIVRVIAEIRPDLIALQEAQHNFRPSVGMLDEGAIERGLGLRFLRVAERPSDQGWRGNVVLVRRDAAILRPPVGLRLGGLEPRGGISAELDLGWGPFRLITAHLSLGAERRRRQARALLEAADAGAGQRLPTLVLGDFNDSNPRASALGSLEAAVAEPPRAPTFPSFFPVLSPDRIMGRPRGLVLAVEAHDTPLARRASDHLPIKARIDTALLAGSARAAAAAPARATDEPLR